MSPRTEEILKNVDTERVKGHVVVPRPSWDAICKELRVWPMVFAHALLRGPEQAFTYDINGKSIEQRAREWAEGFKQTGQPDFQDKAIALDGIGLTARSRNALLRKDQTLQYDASRVLHILPHHIRNFGPVSFVDTLHCLVVAGFPWLNLIDGSVFWRTAPASWKERWKVHMRIGK